MKAKKKAKPSIPAPKKAQAGTKTGSKANRTNRTHLRARVKVPRIDGKPGKPNDFTPHHAFLEALRSELDVHAACAAAGFPRSTAYEHKAKDAAFSKEWEDILDGGVDQVEGKLTGRLINGVVKKKFTAAGEAVIDPVTGKQYYEVEYDNNTALRFLAARRPEIYGDKSKVEISEKRELSAEEVCERYKNFKEGLTATIRASLGPSTSVAKT